MHISTHNYMHMCILILQKYIDMCICIHTYIYMYIDIYCSLQSCVADARVVDASSPMRHRSLGTGGA